MKKTMLIVLIIFGAGFLTSVQGQTKNYVDPNGAFAIQIPVSWTSNRVALGIEEGWITELASANAGPRIECIVIPVAEGLSQEMLEEEAEPLIEMTLQLINASGSVLSQKISKTTFNGRAAVRCDLTYNDSQDRLTRKGYLVVALGRKNSLLVLVSAPQNDGAALGQAERWANSLAIESTTPAAAAAASSQAQGLAKSASLFTSTSLSRTAQKIRSNLKRDSADTVLINGDPPLTHGSVANFVRLVSDVFEIEFNEVEFDLTRQRFSEYYAKADAAGKTQIALGGASLLGQIHQGTAAQQAQTRKEVRDIMEQRFAAGAQAGIEWAQALNDAISKRAKTMSVSTVQPPAQYKQAKLKSTFTEADLDASLEMLYFMWVASGRNPAYVTPEAAAQVRQYLALNFSRFSPTLQYWLANAEHFYGSMRAAWQQANDSQRLLMAQQYGQALNEMGLVEPQVRTSGGGGGSAWSDVAGTDPSRLKAELAMSYAGSAATSSSFSGRKITW